MLLGGLRRGFRSISRGELGCISDVHYGLNSRRLAVAVKARALRASADVNEKLALEKMRGKLLADIEKFRKTARTFVPHAALAEAARRRARGGPLVRLDHEPVFSAFCC